MQAGDQVTHRTVPGRQRYRFFVTFNTTVIWFGKIVASLEQCLSSSVAKLFRTLSLNQPVLWVSPFNIFRRNWCDSNVRRTSPQCCSLAKSTSG
jgi:hypothetical protein